MSVRRNLSVLKGFYISAHSRRRDFFSWKWRLFVMLLVAAVALVINDYVHDKYALAAAYTIDPQTGGTTEFVLADKLFNWFMTGTLFGIIALAALYEGEFVLGLRKMIRQVGKGAAEAGKSLGKTFEGGGRKGVKRPKR